MSDSGHRGGAEARAATGVFYRSVDLLEYLAGAGYKIGLDDSGNVVLEPQPIPGGPLATALITHRAALGAQIRAGYHRVLPKKR